MKGEERRINILIIIFLAAATTAILITMIGQNFETIMTEALKK